MADPFFISYRIGWKTSNKVIFDEYDGFVKFNDNFFLDLKFKNHLF